MAVAKLRQVGVGIGSSLGETTMSTTSRLIPRAFDIELDIQKRVHEYDYQKGGLFSDRAIVSPLGATSTQADIMHDTKLRFKTYLYGYKDVSAGAGLDNTNALIAMFQHTLGGYDSPSERELTTAGALGTVSGAAKVLTWLTASPGISDVPDGSGVMFEDSAADSRFRWLTEAVTSGTTSTMNRDLTSSGKNAFAPTVCWTRDIVPSSSFLMFEVASEDPEDVYVCVGCYGLSANIVMKANELTVVEWEFVVSHFHRLELGSSGSGGLWGSGGSHTNLYADGIETLADEPYPFTYSIVKSDLAASGTFADLDVSEMNIKITNELSPVMSPNSKYGISATMPNWAKVGQTIDVDFKTYYAVAPIATHENQTPVEIDILLPQSNDATAGNQGFVAMRIPQFRVKAHPGRDEIEGQLAQSFSGTADWVKGDGAVSTTSERNAAAGPVDSEFRIAFT